MRELRLASGELWRFGLTNLPPRPGSTSRAAASTSRGPRPSPFASRRPLTARGGCSPAPRATGGFAQREGRTQRHMLSNKTLQHSRGFFTRRVLQHPEGRRQTRRQCGHVKAVHPPVIFQEPKCLQKVAPLNSNVLSQQLAQQRALRRRSARRWQTFGQWCGVQPASISWTLR